jgi:hypothetical protein
VPTKKKSARSKKQPGKEPKDEGPALTRRDGFVGYQYVVTTSIPSPPLRKNDVLLLQMPDRPKTRSAFAFAASDGHVWLTSTDISRFLLWSAWATFTTIALLSLASLIAN